MNKEELRELGLLIAIEEYCKNRIEDAKTTLRKMTNEEINEINEGIFLVIDRQSHTNTIYSSEYKEELKKLKEKYPPTKEKIENHKITLNATNYSSSKAKIIIDNVFTQNKTALKNMVANTVKK